MTSEKNSGLVSAGSAVDRSMHSSAMAQLMIDSIHDYAVFMLDPAGKVLSWNIGAARIMGYAAAEIIGRHFSCFYADETRESEPLRALEGAALRRSHKAEGWLVRKDGGRFWAAVVIEPVRGADGIDIGFAEVIRDTTEQREAEEDLRQANAELERRVEKRTRELNVLNDELAQLADTDPLTGIFNRRGFMAVAKHELGRSTRYHTPFSILFIDIDKFKDINDSFGHAAGDRVLQMVVAQMGGQLRGADVMARIGGDEFVLMLMETTADRAMGVAKRLCRGVAAAKTEIAGKTFIVHVSVGVAQWAGGESVDELLARADAALYQVKADANLGGVVAAAAAG